MQKDLVIGRAANSTDPLITPQGGIDDGSGNSTAAGFVALAGKTPLMPFAATRVVASSGNVADASGGVTVSLPAVAGKTNYLSGFSITAGGATAAATVAVTISGMTGGPMTYIFGVPSGSNNIAYPLIEEYTIPIPASAPNTAITITLPALGSGNTSAAVNIHGYVL